MYNLKRPLEKRVGKVCQLKIGNTINEGGTRSHSVIIGGAVTMPYYNFEAVNPHPPLIVPMIFDDKRKLPKPVISAYGDVVEDPVAWAKACVKKLGARAICIQLSTPQNLGKSVEKAIRVLDEIINHIKVPLIVGGSGDPTLPDRDVEVLTKAAEVASGERILLSFATTKRYKTLAEAAKKHGHAIVASSPTDINLAKQLNSNLFKLGFQREDVLMDPVTAALGWGIEYTYTIFQRIRQLALMGDESLQTPLLCAACNAWTAKEAELVDNSIGEPRPLGIVWEAVTALAHIEAGADMVFMLHPKSIAGLEKFLLALSKSKQEERSS